MGEIAGSNPVGSDVGHCRGEEEIPAPLIIMTREDWIVLIAVVILAAAYLYAMTGTP